MFRIALSLTLALAASNLGAEDWFPKAVKSVTAEVSPAEAKPGQTVTWKLTLELAPGYHTYPFKQSDKNAAAMVNKIKFPTEGNLLFVDDIVDPEGAKVKAEPALDIQELRYYVGKVVFERKAVVLPTAKEGEMTVKVPSLKLNICNESNCWPPKAVNPEAKFKILAGPAVEVEKKYRDQVEKTSRK